MDTNTAAFTKAAAPSSTARTKLHPTLEKLVAAAEQANRVNGSVEVVVTFQEEYQVPRFPEPNEAEARDSTHNLAARANAEQLVRDIRAARAPGHARRASELAKQLGATVQDQFWLINGMQVSLPLGKVRALAARSDVQYVEEREKNIPPPANNSSDARADMSTDPYFNLNQTGGWYGLLDTGVRTSHTLLTHYAYLRDCVSGGSDCNTGALGV